VIRVTENFRKIQDLLAKAATEAGRRPEAVRLLAASKTQSPETVLEAVAAGQRDFGENFAKEGMDKMVAVGRDDLTWHFIGHIQSNKTRLIAENFAWVHTLDRLKIAERLSKQRPFYADELSVCIEVNVDNEEGKSGVTVENTLQLAQAISDLPRIRLRGLMCIPAIHESAALQRKPFARLAELAEDLALAGVATDTLSMGMTADFVPAIQEGATIVRIGTALFGPRKKKSN
jgi:pyridoxal phosphate enzyme (YggS family)